MNTMPRLFGMSVNQKSFDDAGFNMDEKSIDKKCA